MMMRTTPTPVTTPPAALQASEVVQVLVPRIEQHLGIEESQSLSLEQVMEPPQVAELAQVLMPNIVQHLGERELVQSLELLQD